MTYKILAYWPNARTEPLIEYVPHFATALDRSLKLMRTGQHMTISVLTRDGLELIRLWGQPMPDGKDWP